MGRGSVNAIDELIHISQVIGKKIPVWVQGAGGNISVKTDAETLWIKASGKVLKNVQSKEQLTCVDLKKVQDFFEIKLKGLEKQGEQPHLEDDYASCLQESIITGSRPSMETGFHGILPSKWVFHFHSVVSVWLAHVLEKDPARWEYWLSSQLLTNGLREWSKIPPMRPGLLLSWKLQKFKNSSVILLANHGIILQGDSLDVIAKWERIEESFCEIMGFPKVSSGEYPLPGKIPARIVFPDVAVFWDRILPWLKDLGDGTVEIKAECKDEMVRELWEATELVINYCPDLMDLPHEISSKVADLPTEKWRRN